MTIQRTRLHASTLTLFALISLVLVLPGVVPAENQQ